MKKKLILGLLTIPLVAVAAPMFAAFEAHVVNVTATIENALYVHPQSLAYGTVFPEQHLDTSFFVTFSESFSVTGQTRVGTVDYIIKQKPQCVDGQGNLRNVGEDQNGNFVCPLGTTMRPLLCPYLSKEPALPSKFATSTPPFHDPNASSSWAHGELTKFSPGGPPSTVGSHPAELWNVDIAAPCFKGQCSQDWASFVHGLNPNAGDPAQYELDPSLHGQTLGCDLWVEVTSIH